MKEKLKKIENLEINKKYNVVKLPEMITVFSHENFIIAKNQCNERNRGDSVYILACK